MKASTLAVILRGEETTQLKSFSLVDVISDDREIHLLESTLESPDSDPLQAVYEYRSQQQKEEEEFGNYVEDLLSQPCVRREIQEHGVQWLRSKIRIEMYKKTEAEAAQVIAEFAQKLFEANPQQNDFMLAGPTSTVRVRIFVLKSNHFNRRFTPSAA